MLSLAIDPSIKDKLIFKINTTSLNVRPFSKHCKKCKAVFPVMGVKFGDEIKCPECNTRYVLRQEVVFRAVIDPVEMI